MTRETLLLAAVQSGALFLAIWLIFRLVPSIPANAKAWIWRIAFLKPLASLLPFAVVTLYVLPAAPSTVVITEGNGTAVVSDIAPALATPSYDPILVLWLLGVAGVALYGLANWVRALRIVRHAQPVMDDSIQEALRELTGRAGVGNSVELLCSASVPSAMLVGGLRPTIVLPAASVTAGAHGDIRLMLAHEVAHLARRDLPWFGVIWAVQSLFFFNPLAWVAARCARLDHESATDRHASHLAEVPIQTYAEMLLRATVVARTPLVPGTVPMAESYRTIHRRLEAMKHFNARPTIWRKSAVAVLALGTVGLLPVYQLAEAAPVPQEPAAAPAPPKPKKKPAPKVTQAPRRAKLITTKNGKQVVYFVKWSKGGIWTLTDAQGNVKKTSKNLGAVLPAKASHSKPKPAPKVKKVPAPVPPSASSFILRGGQASASTSVGVGGQADAQGFATSQASGGNVQGSGQNVARAGGVSVGRSASGQGTQVSSHGRASGSASGQGFGLTTRTVNGQKETVMTNGTGSSHATEYAYSSTSASGSGTQTTETVSMTLDKCDIHDALRALFRHGKKSYEIDTNIKGTVTLSVQNVTFEAALRSMVRAAGATYRVEDGTYIVTPLEKSE